MSYKKIVLMFVCITIFFCGRSFANWGDRTHEYILETINNSGLYKSSLEYSSSFKDNSDNVLKINLRSAALSLDESLIERTLESTPVSLMNSSEYFLAEGIKYYLQGNWAQSIGALSICIDKDPLDIYSWYYMAKDYELRNDYNSANYAYQKALSIDPNSVGVLKSYARFLNQAGLTDQYNIVKNHIKDIYSRDSNIEIFGN